jgi:hypothetical protein
VETTCGGAGEKAAKAVRGKGFCARRMVACGVMENRQSVENFLVLGAKTAANLAVFPRRANLNQLPF